MDLMIQPKSTYFHGDLENKPSWCWMPQLQVWSNPRHQLKPKLW